MIDVADERAIGRVLLAYATGIDTRDWTLFRTCFTDNFEGEYPGFGDFHSADEITAFMDQAHAGLGPTLHRMTNFVIDGDASAATARSYVDVILMPQGEGPIHQAAGWYEDDLNNTDSGWKIARRVFHAVVMRTLPKG